MIIQDVDGLQCNLPPLEQIKPNAKNRYALQLKSNFNVDDCKHLVEYLGKRIFAYQYGFFYEHQIELPKEAFAIEHEYLKDIKNTINDTTDNINRFTFRIKMDKIVNEFPKENKGPKELTNIDWCFAISFINMYNLNGMGYLNTEDLSFTTPEASFFGRSVAAVFLQNYVNVDHRARAAKNFNVIKLEEPQHVDSFKKIVEKQRDLCLTRQETIDLLKSVKCRKTGKDLSVLLEPKFELFTA